ncbi:hypothetical protein CGI82_08380 [Vibrio parahaemolyticus]|nr:hypothetical protein CGI82_08380 [Vibrio parahaemolyticus]
MNYKAKFFDARKSHCRRSRQTSLHESLRYVRTNKKVSHEALKLSFATQQLRFATTKKNQQEQTLLIYF